MLLMKLSANWTFICSLRDLECLLEGHSLSPEIKTGKDWERRRLTKKFITQCVHFVLSPVMRCFYFFRITTNRLLMFMRIRLICAPINFTYLLTYLLTCELTVSRLIVFLRKNTASRGFSATAAIFFSLKDTSSV